MPSLHQLQRFPTLRGLPDMSFVKPLPQNPVSWHVPPQDVLQHLSQLDYQAYCTIFAINGGPESFRKFMAQASAALDVCVKDFTALAKVVSA
eukprot:g18371.t1